MAGCISHELHGGGKRPMAFFTGNLYSKSLLIDTQLNIILPHDGRFYCGNGNPKTLILLHGLSDNASVWYRRTSIERYAEQYDLTVVMPEVQRSYYNDMLHGQNAYTYISDELPEMLGKMFRTSIAREDLLIAGLSMGAYGAIRCAFGNPGRFGFCGAFSGAYDIQELLDLSPEGVPVVEGFKKDVQAIFGSSMKIPVEVTIPHILNAAAKNKNLPKLYMTCGKQDFLYGTNLEIRNQCKMLPIDVTYEEWDGIHEWSFWDKSIEKMLAAFLGTTDS
jgi:putative tributyrin esterase